MDIYQGIILGALQGLTEFLPVSSSGHLVLGQKFFGINEPSLSFNIALHFGTLLAVFIVFFKDIKNMICSFFKFLKALFNKNLMIELLREDAGIKLIMLIIIGSVPTAVIGLLIEKYGEKLFSSLLSVGIMLLVTSTILWLSKRASNGNITLKDFSKTKSLLIGIVQGLAVIPGISRSGSTVVAGLFLGIERELAARFSFLLSVPAILGATALEFKDIWSANEFIIEKATIYGTISAFIIGCFSLILLLKLVKKGKFYWFAPYCALVGVVSVCLSIFN